MSRRQWRQYVCLHHLAYCRSSGVQSIHRVYCDKMTSLLLVMVVCVVGTALGGTCPEGQGICATGMTCCILPSGQEGCCPYTNATCCLDKVHCCPMGTTCSTKGIPHCQDHLGSTVAEPSVLEHSVAYHANVSAAVTILGNEMCNDGSQCPDESTCCAMKGGGFGCCPFPAAVCCSDKLHCCREGTRCDDAGFCHSQQAELKYSKWSGSRNVSTNCPGGEFKCPDGNTCCSIGKEDWGCCPLPNAVCCADQEHCCPHGHHCVDVGGCARQ